MTIIFHRRIIGRMIHKIIKNNKGTIVYFNRGDGPEIFDLIQKIKQEVIMYLTDCEAFQIYMIVKKTQKIKGNIAEVGVYNGGSSKIICEAKGERPLYLFDTFDGLPAIGQHDNIHHKGQFNDADYEAVRNYLKEYPNVNIFKGLFPKTAIPIKNKRFSFVHLDVDIYESTLSCLKYFYPRMSKGGVILFHDYVDTKGVQKAFDDFFKNKPEPILIASGSQCLIVKL